MTRRALLPITACLLLLAVSVPATAAQNLGDKWKKADAEAVDSILAGKYKKADRKLEGVLDEMFERLGPGKAGKYAMGLVLMHRALAEAGLGKHRDALWDWHVALNFNPSLEDGDLTRFGELGVYLKRNPLRVPDLDRGTLEQGGGHEKVMSVTGEIDPPKARKHPQPVFPFGAKVFGVEGLIIVQTIITKDGEVTHPVVLKDLNVATITYSALQALRKWRFRPARLDGKPVVVYYNLTINYHLH